MLEPVGEGVDRVDDELNLGVLLVVLAISTNNENCQNDT